MLIQEFSSNNTSNNTNLNQISVLIKQANFTPGSVNLDYGGGMYSVTTEYLADRGVMNLVWDKYNRTEEQNSKVEAVLETYKADTVTMYNVLNVIKEKEARFQALQHAASLLKSKGTMYISVYEGSKSGRGNSTAKGWQNNKTAKQYLPEVAEALNIFDISVEFSKGIIKAEFCS